MKYLLTILIFLTSSILAEQKNSISGAVTYKGKGTLKIILVDKASFGKNGAGLKVISQIIQKSSGQCKFQFDDIPSGEYGIKCYFDKNGNGKLDRGAFGPKEPWGMSFKGKRPMGRPRFSQIAFYHSGSTTKSIVVK